MSLGRKRVDPFIVVTVLLAIVSLTIGFRKFFEPAEQPPTGQTTSGEATPPDVAVVNVEAPLSPSAAAICRQEYFAAYREVLAENDECCPTVNLAPAGYQGPWNVNPVISRSNVGDVSVAGVPDIAITGICAEGFALYVTYRNAGGSAPGIGGLELSSAESDRRGKRIVRQRLDVELPLPGKTLRTKPVDIRLLRLDDGDYARLSAKFSMPDGVRDANAGNEVLEQELIIDTDGSTCMGAPPPMTRNAHELWDSVARHAMAAMNIACRREIWASTGKWVSADEPLCLNHEIDDRAEQGSQGAPAMDAP